MRKIKKSIILILLVLILIFLLLIYLPFASQKSVSKAFVQEYSKRKFFENDLANERAKILMKNLDAMFEKIHAIKNAEEKIYLSTYRFEIGESGEVFLGALLDAAERGVEIDLLIDDKILYLKNGPKKYFKILDKYENINIKAYNPVNILKPSSLAAILHDKYLIIDDDLYILGGRNIADRFNKDSEKKVNYDWDILVFREKPLKDDSFYQLSSYFNEVYNSKYASEVCCDDKKFTNRDLERIGKLSLAYKDYIDENPEILKEKDYFKETISTKNINLVNNPIHNSIKNL